MKDLSLCPNFAQSRPCPHTPCKFNHDIQAYLASKPQDLDGVCPDTQRGTKCRFGWACRFAGKHVKSEIPAIDQDTQITVDAAADGGDGAATKAKEEVVTIDEGVVQQAIAEKIENEQSRKKQKIETTEQASSISIVDSEYITNADRAFKIKIQRAKGKIQVDMTKERVYKRLNAKGKLYLAPLTTVGNLPFRKICVQYGADMTCGEMIYDDALLHGKAVDWALTKKWKNESCFGVQICGNKPYYMSMAAHLVASDEYQRKCDFLDINMGCPIDSVYNRGAGSGLFGRETRVLQIVHGVRKSIDTPLSVKFRMGDKTNIAHMRIPQFLDSGVSLLTLHGRTRKQRYSRKADWEYIDECRKVVENWKAENPENEHRDDIAFFGNGDCVNFEQYNEHINSGLDGVMLARGALIKPWLFTEIKEQRHWDISANERMDMMEDYARTGLDLWGSDDRGVATTRRFLLELCSFTHRYTPYGVSGVPQLLGEYPPKWVGRSDLETMMGSPSVHDWLKLTELAGLGRASEDFSFTPKHKASDVPSIMTPGEGPPTADDMLEQQG